MAGKPTGKTSASRPSRPVADTQELPAVERPDAQPAAKPQPSSGQKPASKPQSARREPAQFRPFEGTSVDSGAGFLLGLLFWGWIGLPFLRGGQTEVRKVLKAKFLNKAPDGSWLP